MSFIAYIIIGILAGYVAGKLTRGRGYGCFINLVLGIVGGLVGGYILELLQISWGGFFGSLATSIIGAFVVLILANLCSPRK